MRTPIPAPPEPTSLDRRITVALAVLRRARAGRMRLQTPDSVYAEEVAEARLNVLLDYRGRFRDR